MTSKKHNFIIFAKINYMKSSIVRNLSWVIVCSVIAKILGGVCRIVLTRVLGADIGLYQMVFSAYSLLIVLISSGIPMAISKIVSSRQDGKYHQKALNGAVAILFSVSGILALLLTFGSKGLAILQGNVNIFSCYIILAPSLIFSAGIAVLKGYYQGVNKFNVSALSGIIEQVIKVLFGLILIFVLNNYYILGALFGAMIGVVLGDIVGFAYSINNFDN